MLLNNLRLNIDKTELLALHAKHRPKPPLDSIIIGDATVEPTSSARNIGAVSRLVTSRLDHCKALLYGLPDFLIQRLQYVINAAAKRITCKRKFDHVTPLLIELHWLPVRQRIVI